MPRTSSRYDPTTMTRVKSQDDDDKDDYHDNTEFELTRLVLLKLVLVISAISLLCIALIVGLYKNTQNLRAAQMQTYTNTTTGGSSGNIPFPPESLHQICSPLSVQQSRDSRHACETACAPAECCMQEDESLNCFDANGPNGKICADYAPCVILMKSEDADQADDMIVVPAAPLELEELCTAEDDDLDMVICMDACRKASCCWAPSSHDPPPPPNNNCYAENLETCSDYSICTSALPGGWMEDEDVVSIDPDVAAVCTSDNIGSSGSQGWFDCEAVCMGRSCCFGLSAEPDCSDKMETWCAEYAPCAKLTTDWVDNDDPTSSTSTDNTGGMMGGGGGIDAISVTEACHPSNTDYAATCESLCAPKMCCFQEAEAIVDVCDFEYPQVVCDEFQVCSKFYTLPNICSVSNIKTAQGFAECKDLCEPSMCCVSEESETLTSGGSDEMKDCNADLCRVYKDCKPIWTLIEDLADP